MASDLFQALGVLWTKQKPASMPSFFVLHRFLASDPDFAQAAKVLQKDIREPDILLSVWQGLLPKARGAPQLTYAAAKKSPEADALVQEMMAKIPDRREVCEEIVAMFDLLGRTRELYIFYGVEPPKEKKK